MEPTRDLKWQFSAHQDSALLCHIFWIHHYFLSHRMLIGKRPKMSRDI